MTTNGNTLEKHLEKKIFDILSVNDKVKEAVERLEVLVLREGDGDSKVKIYGQLFPEKKERTAIDTLSTELELNGTWTTNDLDKVATSIANRYNEHLEIAFESFMDKVG